MHWCYVTCPPVCLFQKTILNSKYADHGEIARLASEEALAARNAYHDAADDRLDPSHNQRDGTGDALPAHNAEMIDVGKTRRAIKAGAANDRQYALGDQANKPQAERSTLVDASLQAAPTSRSRLEIPNLTK